ncbi:hypothetical protein, partial [Tabrizicola sp.]|uniref:hypothetical protein n=1 Tax=Tabrizicola sp. TaxID=2005166 RepID=UPI003F40D961
MPQDDPLVPFYDPHFPGGGVVPVTNNDGADNNSVVDGNAAGRVNDGLDPEEQEIKRELEEFIAEKKREIADAQAEIDEIKDFLEGETDPTQIEALTDDLRHAEADQLQSTIDLMVAEQAGVIDSFEAVRNDTILYWSGIIPNWDEMSGQHRFNSTILEGGAYLRGYGIYTSTAEQLLDFLSPNKAGQLGGLAGEGLKKALGRYWRRRLLRQLREGRKRAQERIKRRASRKRRGRSCRNTGNPTYVVTGSPVAVETVFSIPGRIPFSLDSVFDGQSGTMGPLGRNRLSALDAVITREEDGRLKYLDDELDPVFFDQPSPNPGAVTEGDTLRYMTLKLLPMRGFAMVEEGLTQLFQKYKDGAWRLVGIENKNEERIVLRRDAEGLLERIDHPEGLSVHFDNDIARGLRLAAHLVAPDGQRKAIARYEYDDRSNLVRLEAPYATTLTYKYDGKNRLIDTIKDHGYRSSRSYDDENRVVGTVTNGPYNGDRFEYDDINRITTYFPGGDPEKLQKFYIDDMKNVRAEANALGHFKRTLFDETGNVAAEVDAEGNATRYTYDVRGNVKSVTDPAGRENTYYWTASGKLEIAIDNDASSWDYEYDERENLVAVQDPLGHRTDIVNNHLGQPLRIMRHDGLLEVREYDDYGRLVELIDYRGAKTEFTYDSFNRVILICDPSGAETRLDYTDQRGFDFYKPSRLTRPDGAAISVSASAGETKVTDAEGRTTTYSFGFGPNNLLTRVKDARGGAVRFHYDGLERLVRIENQKGLFWTFERDAAGRVIRETDFDDRSISYAYDAADRVIEREEPDGVIMRYTYDPSGLITEEALVEPNADDPRNPLISSTRYEYDLTGLLESVENAEARIVFDRDKMGRIISERITGPVIGSRRIDSAYDCCGNRTERKVGPWLRPYQIASLGETIGDTGPIIPPPGTRLSEMVYDPLGALKSLAISGMKTLTISRDAMGREVRRDGTKGFVLEQSFDAMGQLTQQRAGKSGPALPVQPMAGALPEMVERAYGWSRAYEPVSIADHFGERRHVHDQNGQLTETRFGDGHAERFEYDAALNLLGSEGAGPDGISKMPVRRSAAGPPLVLTPWQISSGGRVRQAHGPRGERIGLTYDQRGRVSERIVERSGFRSQRWRYRWDGRDRLVGCTTPDGSVWAYGYDAFGRRLWKRQVSGAEVSRGRRAPDMAYLWDGDLLAQEVPLGASGPDWEKAVTWHYEPESFRPL